MKNRLFKAFLCAILAIAIIVSSTVGFGAVIKDETNEIIIYDETITLKNNEVFISAYNITENYQGSLTLSADNSEDSIVVKGTDLLNGPQKMSTKAGVFYAFKPGVGTSAIGGKSYKYDNTGGMYRKVRAKLSRYYFFNEDGSHTTEDFTYHFGDTEYDGKSSYKSVLVIASGAAITFAVPDKNGFVEFYTSTAIDVAPAYYATFSYTIYTDTSIITGGGGGVNGSYMVDFKKGRLRDTYISIGDVTQLQLYLSKMVEFSDINKYRADVDNNNEVSILDATQIQLYLAKIYG